MSRADGLEVLQGWVGSKNSSASTLIEHRNASVRLRAGQSTNENENENENGNGNGNGNENENGNVDENGDEDEDEDDPRLRHDRLLGLIERNRSQLVQASLQPFSDQLPGSVQQPHHLSISHHHSPSPAVDNNDSVQIQILLSNSNQPKKCLQLSKHSKVHQIKKLLFVQWPPEWNNSEIDDDHQSNTIKSIKPNRLDQCKLVFLGQFLNDEQTLSDLRLNPNSPTIFHLVIKPIEPELPVDPKKSTHTSFLSCLNCFSCARGN